ncbi:MAG: hypothetical protein HN341_08570 [Verrucomicrobia bacterium]|jgi:hypothetical protein|nr:hypothetical protein [Verrucomicrobiota bacterium]
MKIANDRQDAVKAWSGQLMVVALCLIFSGAEAVAQDEDDMTFGGIPLENAIAGHNLGVRIRAEVLYSEDDASLLDDDVAYEQFPSEVYDTEVRVFQNDGLSVAAAYSEWDNAQGLDTERTSLTVRSPWGEATKLTWRYSHLSKQGSDPNRDYLYLGISRRFGEHLYSYTQYRNTGVEDEADVHQFSQYVSWTAAKRYRLGCRGAISLDDGEETSGPWYVDAFGSAYVWKQSTSIRLSHRHYDTGEALTFDETKCYLYHRLFGQTLLRLSYRLYSDSDDMKSDAYGASIKQYFSARGAVHVGYRFYDHKIGADLDSLFAGFSILL